MAAELVNFFLQTYTHKGYCLHFIRLFKKIIYCLVSHTEESIATNYFKMHEKPKLN